MDGRCKTCKHWRDSWLTKYLPDHGECSVIGDQEPSIRGNPTLQDRLAFIPDDEYEQNLATRADFGCVLWEPKA